MSSSDQIKITDKFDRFAIIILSLLALTIRLWALGSKGLRYDEAFTAIVSQAAPEDIISLHWRSAFEHPPLWPLTMHLWVRLFGYSEAYLRLLPALAGALLVPLYWQFLKQVWPKERSLRVVTSILITFSPVLLQYSQEARMYSIVTLLAMLSLYSLFAAIDNPSKLSFIVFILSNWLMIGFHYYSVVLLVTEGMALCILLITKRDKFQNTWTKWIVAFVISGLPLLFWMLLAPGFRDTAEVVRETRVGGGSLLESLSKFWREVSFGAIPWQPQRADWGFALLFPFFIGIIVLPLQFNQRYKIKLLNWIPAIICIAPIIVSMVMFQSLRTRYLIFVIPLIFTFIAAGSISLFRINRLVGIINAFFVAMVFLSGVFYYFADFHKSEYREMVNYLTEHSADGDALLLEGPRQHLLTKYYFAADLPIYTAPDVTLPDYWTVNAPPVVPEEMDDQLQTYLHRHSSLWLILAGQGEVDRGEFVPRYLTAVSYRENCEEWLDVTLCHFVSADAVAPDVEMDLHAHFTSSLTLLSTQIAVAEFQPETKNIFIKLDWLANITPEEDYKVTLRLIDSNGTVISQSDGYPIGPLLPPSTWNDGDQKTGFMSLSLPAGLENGKYSIDVGMYDPVTMAIVPYTVGTPDNGVDLLRLADLEVNGSLLQIRGLDVSVTE